MRSRIEMILTAVLTVLALVVAAVLVEETLQDYFNLRQQQSVVATADIRTINAGMTIPAISQRYHVPESDLYGSLHLKGARLLPQTPLPELAVRAHLPVTKLIRNIQVAILVYQDLHPQQGEEVLSRLLIMLINWFQQYGYPVLWLVIFVAAAGAPLPVGLLLTVVGAFAALGDFNVVWLALLAISASACGDSLGYLMGRTLGSSVLAWIERQRWYHPPSSRSIARARAYFKRRGAWAIVMSRFLFSALGGTINVIAGADNYPYRRFVLYDIAGETLGAIIPLALGYAFGATWEDVGDLLTMGSLCVLTLLVTAVLVRRLFSLAQRLKASAHAAQQQLQNLDKQAVEIVKAVENPLPLSQREV